jgi:hypothetical protein
VTTLHDATLRLRIAGSTQGGTAIMDGARFHDIRDTGLEDQARTARYGRRNRTGRTRIVAAVVALLALTLMVAMTNLLPRLFAATGMANAPPGPAASHLRMRF